MDLIHKQALLLSMDYAEIIAKRLGEKVNLMLEEWSSFHLEFQLTLSNQGGSFLTLCLFIDVFLFFFFLLCLEEQYYGLQKLVLINYM